MKTHFPQNYFCLCLALLLALAVPAQAQVSQPTIKSTQLSGNTLTIQLQNFPSGSLTVRFNGLVVPNTYNQPAQQVVATLAIVPPPGTYLLNVARSSLIFATADVTIGAAGPQGPPGPPDPRDRCGRPGRRDRLVWMEPQARWGQKDPRDLKAFKVRLDYWAPTARKVSRASKAPQELTALPVLKDLQVHKGLPAPMVRLAHKDHRGRPVCKVPKAFRAHPLSGRGLGAQPLLMP
ncbi:MAG TPA: hypothetical protein VI136_06655 [Verrucomicrobiae bacterium]